MDSPLVGDCATSALEDQIQTERSSRVELYHEHGLGVVVVAANSV